MLPKQLLVQPDGFSSCRFGFGKFPLTEQHRSQIAERIGDLGALAACQFFANF